MRSTIPATALLFLGIFFSICGIAGRLAAQPITPRMGQVTGPVLPLEEYLQQVLTYHPAARRANLLALEARAYEQLARGGFDPELFVDYDDKFFKGTDYWDIGEGGLRLPTLGGVEFGGGYRWATGSFLNPENFQSPTRGQSFVGLKANLLSGLVTDQRRTDLRRADLLQDWNALEATAQRNDLAYDAIVAYIQWAYLEEQAAVLVYGLELTELRLQQTIQSFEAGDKPALDTLETSIQLQTRRADLLSTRADLTAARQTVGQFLWSEEGLPDAMRPQTMPQPTALLLQPAVAGLVSNNPALLAYDFKLRDLELERRLKAQKALPKLTIKYELLAEGFDFTPQSDPEGYDVGDFLLQDNKWGVTFSAPLFFRAARGDLQLNAIKIQQTTLDRQQKAGELALKLEQYEQQIALYRNQLAVYRQVVTDYQTLLEAERTKFDFGESSVFLLNTRENKLLDARLKLIKIEAELSKATTGRQWILGLLAGQ